MDGAVAAGRPARPYPHELAVRDFADVNFPARKTRPLDLRVAAETQIRVALDKHLAIDRTVRVVANGATFAHRLVLEDKWPRLVAMALRAAFVVTRHGESARRFENVAAMRVVALNAIHAAFDYGMALRQIEFSMSLEMTLETRRGIFAGIENKPPARGLDVFAAGTMARFATRLPRHRRLFKMHPCVRACWKNPHDVRVAIEARLVANERRARNFRRRKDRALHCRTGIEQQHKKTRAQKNCSCRKPARASHGNCS